MVLISPLIFWMRMNWSTSFLPLSTASPTAFVTLSKKPIECSFAGVLSYSDFGHEDPRLFASAAGRKTNERITDRLEWTIV